MAKYKNSDRSQMQIKMIDFSAQLVEGTIEHTIDYLVEHKINLENFDANFKNDKTGAPAYHPKVMLKVILYAYSNGITGSRKIEKACGDNIIFMTLACDSTPHFTYIADFIHRFEEQIRKVFLEVLLVCWEMNLLGGEFLALDGCKLPSNSAKEWSGTFSDLKKKEVKIRKTVDFLLEKHKASDDSGDQKKSNQDQIQKITAKADKIRDFLENSQPKMGPRRNEIQSNITDNDSAKMKTSHGTIQGYNGLAMVDSKRQIILHAETHGGNNESQYTREFLNNSKAALLEGGIPDKLLTDATLIADTGFFSEDNLKFLDDENLDSIIPDNNFRKRDPRFQTMDRHREDGSKRKYNVDDFILDNDKKTCICPNEKNLAYKGIRPSGKATAHKYDASAGDCSVCDKKERCLKKGIVASRTLYVAIPKYGRNYSKEMMARVDTAEARDIYSKRMGIVEPVFGNIRACKGLHRFNYRGKRKVNLQWLMYCMMHNIGKIHNALQN
jgi:transposase